ncbi:MAG: Rieske (2Fe-2S) protein [Candidatus Planktophila sp.]
MASQSRRSVLLAAFVGVFSWKSSNAFAAAPTLKPTKVGQTIIFRGKKYTAIKQGKKLVWDKGVLVTTSPTASPAKGVILGKSSSLAMGETKQFKSGKNYFVTRSSSGLFAVDEVCTHQGCAVELSGKELLCPCHGSGFNPADGKVIAGPANRPLKSYPVSDVDGNIVITL